jgi:integrase/recombinase XerD
VIDRRRDPSPRLLAAIAGALWLIAIVTAADHPPGRITPHVFRHTTAVHLLEAGVEVNVIRGWLGHADITTTNRYAEMTVRSKEAAVRACEAPSEFSVTLARRPAWRDDPALLAWLAAL